MNRAWLLGWMFVTLSSTAALAQAQGGAFGAAPTPAAALGAPTACLEPSGCVAQGSSAQVTQAEPASPPRSPRVVLATNNPLGWTTGSYAISGYVRLTANLVVHTTYAKRIDYLAQMFAEAAMDSEVRDVGVSLVYFPSRAWHGVHVELGALQRKRRYEYGSPFDDDEVTTNDLSFRGARAMLGWSHLASQRFFFSVGLGAALGVESDRFRRVYASGEMEAEDTRGTSKSLEGFVRLGVALDGDWTPSPRSLRGR